MTNIRALGTAQKQVVRRHGAPCSPRVCSTRPVNRCGDSPRGIQISSSFQEANYSFDAASNYGYRTVPPGQALRYTSTEPVLPKASHHNTLEDETCRNSTTKGTISTLGDLYQRLNIENPSEILATLAEWDSLLENEKPKLPYLEFFEEDPYLSKYEQTQRDRQNIMRACHHKQEQEVDQDSFDEGYEDDY